MANRNNTNKQAKQVQQLMRMGPKGVIIAIIILAIGYFTGIDVTSIFDQNVDPTPKTQQTQPVQPSQTARPAQTATQTTQPVQPATQPRDGDIISGKVTRVVDGDTIVVSVAGEEKERRVRLLGVDTPETVHPNKEVQFYGPEASAFTKAQLTGKQVWLEYDVSPLDRYQRHLAYVWLKKPVSGKITEKAIREGMYNAHLVLGGYARVMTIQPNSRYANLFTLFQSEARDAKRGLWQNETEEPKTSGKASKKSTKK